MSDDKKHIDENLLTRYLAGEADMSEINMVLEWVDSSDENREEFDQFAKTWSLTASRKRKPFNADKALSKVNKRLSRRRRSLQLFYSGAAAAVIAVILVFTQLNRDTSTPLDAPQFAMSSTDSTVNTTLPDGSEIILAENSNIAYNFDSITDTRTAKLSGEAFFSIKRDTMQKFVVLTDHGGVEVLGTKFNVDVLDNTDVQVDVLSGKVKVFLPRKSGDTLSLILTNNESAIISSKRDTILRQTQKASVFYKINRTLAFKNIDIHTVVSELKESYGVKIELDSAVDKTLRFASTFKENSIEEILTVVTQTLNLKFDKMQDGYIIKNNEE